MYAHFLQVFPITSGNIGTSPARERRMSTPKCWCGWTGWPQISRSPSELGSKWCHRCCHIFNRSKSVSARIAVTTNRLSLHGLFTANRPRAGKRITSMTCTCASIAVLDKTCEFDFEVITLLHSCCCCINIRRVYLNSKSRAPFETPYKRVAIYVRVYIMHVHTYACT